MEIDVDVLEKDINASVDSEVLNASATEENIVNASVEKENVIDCSVKKNIVNAESDNTNVIKQGETDHSKLDNLDYESSGHTGFASKKENYSEIKVGSQVYKMHNDQEQSDTFLLLVDSSLANLQRQITTLSNDYSQLVKDFNDVLETLIIWIAETFVSKNELKTQIDELIKEFTRIEKVNDLPNMSVAKENTIYLVPLQTPSSKNQYEEYIFVNDAWEKIGQI